MEQQAQKSWRGVAVGSENLSHARSDDGLSFWARIAVKIVFQRRLMIKFWGRNAMNSMVLWFTLARISEREKHRDQHYQKCQTKRGALHIQLFMEKTKMKKQERRQIRIHMKAGKLILTETKNWLYEFFFTRFRLFY